MVSLLQSIAKGVGVGGTLNIQISHLSEDNYRVRFTPELKPLESNAPDELVNLHQALRNPFRIEGTPTEIDLEIATHIDRYQRAVHAGLNELALLEARIEDASTIAQTHKPSKAGSKAASKSKAPQSDNENLARSNDEEDLDSDDQNSSVEDDEKDNSDKETWDL